MDEMIVKADKKTRIIYLILIIIIIIAALFIYRYWQSYYENLTEMAEDHPDLVLLKIANLLKIFILINPLVSGVFMIYFITIGVKTYRTQQFPPPGVKVIKDTRLTRGDKAKKYAIGLWLIAVALLIFAVAFTILLNNFIKTIY